VSTSKARGEGTLSKDGTSFVFRRTDVNKVNMTTDMRILFSSFGDFPRLQYHVGGIA